MFAGAALLALAAAPGAALAADAELDAVRAATAAFKDVEAAAAAGYGQPTGVPLEQCIAEPGEGAMGFHHIHGDLVGDAVLDPTKPEALLYLPDANGTPQLLGVEYVVFAEAWDAANSSHPTILGQMLHLVPAPNRYELPAFYQLHTWVWRDNPAGVFESFNPAVECPLPDTAVELPPSGGMPWSPLACVIVAATGLVVARRFAVRLR